ncbi:hypothetical protein FQZ97_980330 [compost metagenome]
MKAKERQSKLQAIVDSKAKARCLAGKISGNQRRFLRVALEKGKELEPIGRLAGPDA